MSSNKQQSTRFEELLALLLDNNLSDDNFEELIELAKHDEEFKAQLRDQLTVDHLLYQHVESEGGVENFVNETLRLASLHQTEHDFEASIINAIHDEESKNTNHQSSNNKLKTFKHYYFPWLMAGASMAACALLSFEYFQNNVIKGDSSSNQFVASEYQDTGVAVIANAISLSKASTFKIGETVQPGQLTLAEGFLELEFYRGAQLKIAGPAKINIIDEEHIQLLSGKVMTDVPKVAIGFTIDTPNSEIIDLGTEIGVEVLADGQSKVHVFEGLVKAKNKHGYSQLIEKGEGVNFSGEKNNNWFNSPSLANNFSEFETIEGLTGNAANLKQNQWLSNKERVLTHPNLVTYYDFEPNKETPRLLMNLSKYGAEHHGAIVGAKWSKGPWQGKHALNFKRASDRVRIELDNKMESFTFATWIQIDSLDRKYNSILLTDGYKPGDMHWQISKLNHTGSGKIVMGLNSLNQVAKDYRYSPFFKLEDSGTWYHLTVRLDATNNKLSMFVNGDKVKEHEIKNPSKYWKVGSASIGNWDNTLTSKPLRNLNGAIAEMIIFNTALDNKYIKSLALKD